MKKFSSLFIISSLLALAVFGYGIYTYFDLLNWQPDQPLHVGALTKLLYVLGGDLGILLGYGVIAVFIFVQGLRYSQK